MMRNYAAMMALMAGFPPLPDMTPRAVEELEGEQEVTALDLASSILLRTLEDGVTIHRLLDGRVVCQLPVFHPATRLVGETAPSFTAQARELEHLPRGFAIALRKAVHIDMAKVYEQPWLEKWKRENPNWHLPYDRNALTTNRRSSRRGRQLQPSSPGAKARRKRHKRQRQNRKKNR